MNEAILVLYLIDFATLALLPVVFFRREGRLNARWWLTALPYILSAASLILSWSRRGLPPFTDYDTWATRILGLISIPLAVTSFGLMTYTLGTHRRRIALWHQTNDAPAEIVTTGAYERIRHPFYTSFLIMLFGAFLYSPQWVSLGAFVYGFAIMNYTAAGEERRLLASSFGREYETYMARTGRFVPRGR
jgi:protein-S-isoprenylcysteine O-methyltransferase Ste14